MMSTFALLGRSVAVQTRQRDTKSQQTDGVGESLDAVRLLKVSEVAELLAVSTREVWRLASAGKIPAPLKLSGRVVRWRSRDVIAFVQGL
jgi:excisionase family DNA binding protein